MSLRRESKKLYFKIILGVYMLTIVLNSYNNFMLTVNSEKFKKLESEISVLNDEVIDLNFRVSQASSLANIEEKSQKLGFVKVEKSVILTPLQLALKND